MACKTHSFKYSTILQFLISLGKFTAHTGIIFCEGLYQREVTR